MKRREAMFALTLAAMPLSTRAQRQERMRRIGVLMSGTATGSNGKLDVAGLLEGLQKRGWVDGGNLQIEYRWADGNADRARAAATELAAAHVDLILCSGTVALRALKDTKVALPIVFVNITDPVAGGFVADLAHPGGNVTGFTPFEYDISSKWLQLLKETVPSITHVALLGDPANHNFAGFLRAFLAAAKSLKVEPTPAPITSTADIERAIEAEARRPNGGLIVSAATFSIVSSDLIIRLADKFRLPAIYWNRIQVQAGGLMSYGPDSRALHSSAADYVDRILKGARPGDLPVQAPTQTDLTINQKTAKALGVTIPPSVLLRANEVLL